MPSVLENTNAKSRGHAIAAVWFTPHGVSHAGPSANMTHRRLDLNGVKARCLQKSAESVRRYGTPASTLRKMAKLANDILGKPRGSTRRVMSLVADFTFVLKVEEWAQVRPQCGVETPSKISL